jgi:hypothetical protein
VTLFGLVRVADELFLRSVDRDRFADEPDETDPDFDCGLVARLTVRDSVALVLLSLLELRTTRSELLFLAGGVATRFWAELFVDFCTFCRVAERLVDF